MPRRREKRTDT
jgi:pre-mRNA-splicing factor SYF1